MRSRFSTKTMLVVTPLIVAVLGGCVWSREVERDRVGAPVVMAPAASPAPVVVSPAPAAPAAVPSTADRVVYQEGRWQLFGDGRSTPYYWVWIPTGATLTGTPAPPARPTSSVSNRTISYPEGRWQLYGDGRGTQYYWVWIPSGVTPPTPPLPPQAG